MEIVNPNARNRRKNRRLATDVQFLYRHRDGRNIVRTFTDGLGEMDWPQDEAPVRCANRMKEHPDAVQRQRTVGTTADAAGRMMVSDAVAAYREKLANSHARPNTKAYRETGLKLVLKTWSDVESLNVRRNTSENGGKLAAWLPRKCETVHSPGCQSGGAQFDRGQCHDH